MKTKFMKNLNFGRYMRSKIDALMHKKRFWMKFSFILLATVFIGIEFLVAKEGYGQELKSEIIALQVEDASLASVFHQIEEQTDLRFAYDPDLVAPYRVTLSHTAVDVKTALEDLLTPTALTYKVLKNKVLIQAKIKQRVAPKISAFEPAYLVKQAELKAYELNLSGTVLDQQGQPLIGVNILVKGTDKGASTDFNGGFTISDVDENAVLVVSYIGYQTQEVPVNGKSNLSITLIEDSQTLDEVVVVGYGTQKKVNVIGSVTTVSSDEITAAPVSKISNALAGRLPGAIFMQDGGEPGKDESTIRIRGNATLGNNSPLVVVDGIPGRDINSLHPEDIESITVLKDASAAIYGARAANGVILVTTKRGSTDTKPVLTYGFYEGLLSPTKLPEVVDAATYATMIRENQSYRGVSESNMLYSEEDVEKYRSGDYPWTHPNTDWYSEALNKFSSTRHHNLSVSGGGKDIGYFASFGAQSDDGIYTNSITNYKRYNFRVNLDYKINPYLSLGMDLTGSKEDGLYPSKSASSIFQTLRRSYPTQHALFPNGFPGPDIEFGDQPMVSASEETGFDDNKTYRSNNIFSANLKLPWVEGLSVSSYYAFDVYNRKRKLFQKPWTLYSFDDNAYLAAGNTGVEDGSEFLIGTKRGFSEPRVTNYSNNNTSSTFNFKIDYTNTFGTDHSVSAFVAYEQNEGFNEGFSAYRRFFVSDQLPYLFAGGDEAKDNNETVSIGARQNYFGRISYNYKEQWLFQFSLRRDGSLNFSEEAGRWGNFPSLLLGWRASESNWWKNNVKAIDYFKLKASWGQLGNDLVSQFQYLTRYGFTRGLALGDSKGYIQGLEQSGFPNPNITWEVANVFNFGWESQFFNSKFGFDADFFYERRNNILVKRNKSVPQFTGITLPDENFGIVDNYGVELILSYNNSINEFHYGMSGNVTFARNEIIESDEPERPVPWQVRTGKPQGAHLLYKAIGIFRDEEHVNSLPHVTGARPGDIIIEDFDGDGEITSRDQQLFPLTTTPELTFGFNFNMSYKNWDLRGLVQGHGRALRYIYDDARAGTAGNYFQYDADDRWTPDNIDGTKPRAYEWTEEYWRSTHITDYHYTDVSYARLKNLQLSYTIPRNLIQKIGISSAKIYASGQNLWLIYSGNKIMDPEVGGIGAYPIMKVYSMGVQVTL